MPGVKVSRNNETGCGSVRKIMDHEEELRRARVAAAVAGDQYADEIDLGIRMDAGAPMPRVLSDGNTAIVLTYLRDDTIGLVTFTGVYNLLFGGLNDEALAGHPLWGRGLDHYVFHEVHNSAWIAECEQRNSVLHMHRGGWHARMRHYIAT